MKPQGTAWYCTDGHVLPEFQGECTDVTPLKINSVLSNYSDSLSAGNASQLSNLIEFNEDEIEQKSNEPNDEVSLAEAFPIITSEANEVTKTINPEQPLEEQEPSRLTPLSIMIADTIGALHSRVLLKVLFDQAPP